MRVDLAQCAPAILEKESDSAAQITTPEADTRGNYRVVRVLEREPSCSRSLDRRRNCPIL